MKTRRLARRLVLLAGLLGALSARAGDDDQSSVAVIEVNAAREFVAQHEDALILDVRTPIEFETSHITGAVNADPDKTYIVHCTKNPSGGRSSRALESMQKLGFRHLYSLEGGYIAWKDADLPLTESSNEN